MEEINAKLRIEAISAKLELCRIVAATLVQKIESPEFNTGERQEYLQRWLEVIHDSNILKSALELESRH
jgi:hypothetical protein